MRITQIALLVAALGTAAAPSPSTLAGSKIRIPVCVDVYFNLFNGEKQHVNTDCPKPPPDHGSRSDIATKYAWAEILVRY